MKRVAIVSSYSESCGNAAFTRVIHDTIEEELCHQVDVFELDLQVLQSLESLSRVKGDQHIKNLCKQLASYDLVNLQFEAGLYGTLPYDIKRRLRWLLRANPKTTITFHSPRLFSTTSSGLRSAIKQLLRFKLRNGLRELSAFLIADRHFSINRYVASMASRCGARFIVHTLRAKKNIHYLCPAANIDVHPLRIVPDAYRGHDRAKEVRMGLGLQIGDVAVGMFGYISAYKGHHDALKAMELLPANFKLFIFGRQHPQTIRSDGTVDSYLSSLIEKIAISKELPERILFMGELDNERFIAAAEAMDIVWMPYYENGQDGSGIAAICFDVAQKIICSTSFAFDELFKLIPYTNYARVDIGNYIQLATTTNHLSRGDRVDNLIAPPQLYTMRTQAELYVKELTSRDEAVNA